MLATCAAWIAEEAAAFGIPIVKLSAGPAQSGGRGVCQHADLGAAGGGHHDCGPHFPIDEVLAMASTGVGPPNTAPTLNLGNGGQEDTTVAICTHPNGTRIDMCWIAPNRQVMHGFADANTIDRMAIEPIPGGTGYTVTCCWLDGNRFQVAVHGTNDAVWTILNTNGRWANNWTPIPNTHLLPVT
jgi:hypothetical protein